MTKRETVWTIIIVAAVATAAVVAWLQHANRLRQSITIEGAVIESNPDIRKELPIADAVITASDGVQSATTSVRSVRAFQAGAAKEAIVREAHFAQPPASELRAS